MPKNPSGYRFLELHEGIGGRTIYFTRHIEFLSLLSNFFNENFRSKTNVWIINLNNGKDVTYEAGEVRRLEKNRRGKLSQYNKQTMDLAAQLDIKVDNRIMAYTEYHWKNIADSKSGRIWYYQFLNDYPQFKVEVVNADASV